MLFIQGPSKADWSLVKVLFVNWVHGNALSVYLSIYLSIYLYQHIYIYILYCYIYIYILYYIYKYSEKSLNLLLVTYATYPNTHHCITFKTDISNFCYSINSSTFFLPLWIWTFSKTYMVNLCFLLLLILLFLKASIMQIEH